MKFELTDEQLRKMYAWRRNHEDVYEGAIGGRYIFMFTPTSLGIVTKVKDVVTESEIDLSDYDQW